MDYTTYESPVGPLLLVGERDAIAGLYFHHGKHTPTPAPDWCRANDAPVFAEACQQLDAYFAFTEVSSLVRHAVEKQLREAG